MKILHCADVHLDSPMQTHLAPEAARRRSAQITQTFVRMTEYARAQGVQAVIIAGDLFDSARVTANTAAMVLQAMRAAPEVQFFYLRGNHDEAAAAFAGQELPANLRLFGEQWTTYLCGEAAVSGVELTPANAETIYDAVPHCEGKTNLVVLHGQVGTAAGVDCVDLSRLRGKGIAYLALGHLHSYRLERLDREGLWCYPGCLEGRGFDECGPKGFVLLELENGRVAPQFVPFAARTLHRVSVDISGMADHARICAKLREAAAGISREDLVEFVLTGAVAPESRLAPEYLAAALEHDHYAVKVKNETRLAAAPEDYRSDVSLKGAYVRAVLASDHTDADKETLIRIGLDALRGEEISL